MQTTQSKAAFVALSQFTVANGMEDEVVQAFKDRPHLVDSAAGFIRMEVMRPTDAPEQFWLMTWWTDESSYRVWHRGHTYHESHQQIPKGLKLVPRTAKITCLELVAN